jgi:hypothetical protein
MGPSDIFRVMPEEMMAWTIGFPFETIRGLRNVK